MTTGMEMEAEAVLLEIRHEAGEEAGHGHYRKARGEVKGGDEEGELLDGAGFNDQFPQSQAAGKKGDHAPHGVAFSVFPGEHGISFFIFQEEHEHAQEEKYVGRLHGREVWRKEGTEEGEQGGGGEENEAYALAPFHGTEGFVHGAEIALRAGQGFDRAGQEKKEKKVHEENEDEHRQETDDPVEIHEFMACQFFQIGNGHQVGGGADGGAEAADAAAPADGKEDGNGGLAGAYILFSGEMEHGHGNGTENSGHYHVGKENGERRGSQEPYKDLALHGGAYGAEGSYGNSFVQSRSGPGQADEVAAQKEHRDFREVLADHVIHGNEVEKGIHDNRDKGGDVNGNGPEYPPQRHPEGAGKGQGRRLLEGAGKKKGSSAKGDGAA